MSPLRNVISSLATSDAVERDDSDDPTGALGGGS